MSKINCDSCSDLREYAPGFVANGVTDEICDSLHEDTGFNPSLVPTHSNEEDLHDANDCLIGAMDSQIDAHEVCDWKDYMHRFIPSVYETLKGMICSMGGLWKKVNKHECELSLTLDGRRFVINEDTPNANAVIVPGKGISYDDRGSNPGESNVNLVYVAGGLMRGSGSITFHATDWTTDVKDIEGRKGKGNTLWRTQNANIVSGGELVYEIRIRKAAFGVRQFVGGLGQMGNMGGCFFTTTVIDEGSYASGQHGGCDRDTGAPSDPGSSSGHLVPSGWVYIQLRATYVCHIMNPGASQTGCTPVYLMGVRWDHDDIC